MNAQKYNGWTNYETWYTALWLNNDESSQALCNELAGQAYGDAEEEAPFSHAENATFALAEQIKELFESDEQIPTSGWVADAVNIYLSEVNWYEIAKHYIDEVEIEQEPEQI